MRIMKDLVMTMTLIYRSCHYHSDISLIFKISNNGVLHHAHQVKENRLKTTNISYVLKTIIYETKIAQKS